MSKGILISPKHGVNPSIECCVFCQKDRGLVLFGKLPGDQEAPHRVCITDEPCDKCKELMTRCIFLVEMKEGSYEDRTSAEGPLCRNPNRTGRMWGVKDEAVQRMCSDLLVGGAELFEEAKKKRVMFIEEGAAKKFGLPGKDTNEAKESKEGEAPEAAAGPTQEERS